MFRLSAAVFTIALGSFFGVPVLRAESVAVRQLEGEVHGFVVLRALDGTIIADGDLAQVTHGREIVTRLVFHFKDGSLQEEIFYAAAIGAPAGAVDDDWLHVSGSRLERRDIYGRPGCG